MTMHFYGPFMPTRTSLNAELLSDFSCGVQTSYAALLRALGEVTHPRAGVDALNLARQSVDDLIDRWRMAQLLALPTSVVQSRFPLAQPPTRSLIDGLLTLAMYSAAGDSEHYKTLQTQIQKLYAAIETEQA
jgi:hypothetical protein